MANGIESVRAARLLKLLTAASEPITVPTAPASVSPVNQYSSTRTASELVLHEDTVDRERALTEYIGERAPPEESEIGARIRYVFECLERIKRSNNNSLTNADNNEYHTSPEEDLAYALTALSDALKRSDLSAAPSASSSAAVDGSAFDPFSSAQRITVEDVMTLSSSSSGGGGGAENISGYNAHADESAAFTAQSSRLEYVQRCMSIINANRRKRLTGDGNVRLTGPQNDQTAYELVSQRISKL